MKRGFLPEETLVQHYTFGSGRLTARFGAVAINPDKDWEKYLPDEERQSNSHFEPYDCTVAASLNAWETVANLLKKKGIIDKSHFPSNCSERFNAILAGITPRGGSPFKSSESIRKRGVILDEVLPFAENIWTWDLFYHPNPMTQELLKLGKETTKYVHLQHEWLFNDESEIIPLKEKRERIDKALERGVACVSMYAWKEQNGTYYKDHGDTDTHWTMLYTLDDYDRCFDTYLPFKKKIAPDTDYYCAMMYTMSPKTQSEIDAEERQMNGLLSQVLGLLQRLYAMLKAPTVVPLEAPVVAPAPPEAPSPTRPRFEPVEPPVNGYKWDTVANARHSVRVICDEEGLTLKQKNELCATVGAESGWQSYYLSGPKKGQPVKLENKKGGVTWSTDWGIAQINDWYNIKEAVTEDKHLRFFPTVQYVLDNPELVIRWMCKQWKSGNANWWIAFKQKTPAYKKYYGLK